MSIIFAMAHDLPAMPTKAVCPWGRRTAPQGKEGGWLPGDQGKTDEAKSRKRGEGDEAEGEESKDNNNEEKGHGKEEDEKDVSNSSYKETESQMKLSSKILTPGKPQAEKDNDEGKKELPIMKSLSHVKWMHVIRYASPQSTHINGLGLRPTQATQQALRPEQRGTLEPHGPIVVGHFGCCLFCLNLHEKGK